MLIVAESLVIVAPRYEQLFEMGQTVEMTVVHGVGFHTQHSAALCAAEASPVEEAAICEEIRDI